ncbi:myeloid leukemia factor 1 isoform X1 [Hippocampus comes]|uniref:myeloid leukemia factor 1 isoform X1 n=1 Tax=Hippocampus comes TaxID=109280 RepID=UPI00094EFCBF|nr:PREDICTED: myeloid leukemia factor 1 isoform X1 [Hippocampus comes]
MFRSGNFGDFDEDPFFSDPFRAHRDHMRQMMRSFSEPFGGRFMPSIMDGTSRDHDAAEPPALRGEHRSTRRKARQARGEHANSTQEGCSQAIPTTSFRTDLSRSLLPFDSTDPPTNPFGMFDSIMTNMRSRMDGMYKNFDMSTDANTHSFSSSSVMTYSKVGNDPPKVFQASSSTRRAPGGVKETVRALKDSESGLEKMAIGHHIQDRGHVIEKKMNKKTGDKELIQDFQNMDESEAQSFDEEWQKELSKFRPSGSPAQLEPPRRRRGQQAPLAGPERTHREQPKSKPKSILKASNSTKQ